MSECDNNEHEYVSNVHKTPDCDSPIRYVRIISKFRLLILRGQHWFCKDDGKPEMLWSLATPFDMEAADEIATLTARLAEAEKRKKQDAHLYIKAMNTIVDLEDRLVAVMDERDELLQQLIDLGGLR
jgi:hypothetical protein